MKTIADALTIRSRVFGAFEMAESAADPEERQRWLTFALVGAGPTGVELAGQIREVATKTLRREYRHIEPKQARVLLFDGGSAPLASFGSKLSALAARDLHKLGVELHMGSVVTAVDSRGLEVKNHDGSVSRHEAGTVLWTAGVEAPPLAEAVATATGAERDRAGRIKVGDDLTIPGHPEVFVLGDLMSAHGLPGVAEVAMQSGLYAARQIRRQVEGRERPAGDPEADGGNAARPFRYRDLGSAAYISRGRAAVAAGRLHFSGFLGLAGLAVHPHRVPDRLPQPGRRDAELVVRVHPRHPPGADVHQSARSAHRARRVRAAHPAHQCRHPSDAPTQDSPPRSPAVRRSPAADHPADRVAEQVAAHVLGGQPRRRLEHPRTIPGVVRGADHVGQLRNG